MMKFTIENDYHKKIFSFNFEYIESTTTTTITKRDSFFFAFLS
jgi:hypothetical protein